MFTRREVLAGASALGISALAQPAEGRGSAPAAADFTRRVLLIDLDDLGHELLEQAMATGGAPNLRRAMLAGRSYAHFWAAPFCSPFRARVLTGLDAYRAGNLVGRNVMPDDTFAGPTGTWLPAGLPGTKAKVGKWHVSNGPTFPTLLVSGGYDRFRGIVQNVAQPGPGSYYDWIEWFADASSSGSQQVTEHHTRRTARLANAEIDLGSEFIHVSFQAIHKPLDTPPQNEPHGKVYSGQTDEQKKLDILFHADHWIGVLLVKAVALGYVVIVACDNGTEDEGKGTHLETGSHTHLFVCGRGVLPGVSSRLVQATDLWATVRRLRGDPSPSTVDSFDFSDDFLPVPAIAAPRPFMTLDWFHSLGASPVASQWSRMLRDARWKYLDRKTSPASTILIPLKGLWDLDNDPQELVNLLNAPLSAEAQSAYDLLLANIQH
jgi:arylsulfatase A-like enzyme